MNASPFSQAAQSFNAAPFSSAAVNTKGNRLVQLLAAAGALISLAYLGNLGMGIVEFIPDNLPLAGNLDEALVTVLLVFCLRKLGIDWLPQLRTTDR
jgi:hypothetical protein